MPLCIGLFRRDEEIVAPDAFRGAGDRPSPDDKRASVCLRFEGKLSQMAAGVTGEREPCLTIEARNQRGLRQTVNFQCPSLLSTARHFTRVSARSGRPCSTIRMFGSSSVATRMAMPQGRKSTPRPQKTAGARRAQGATRSSEIASQRAVSAAE